MDIKLNIAELNIEIKNIDKIPDSFLHFITNFEDEKTDIVYQFCDIEDIGKITEKSIIKNKRNEIYLEEGVYIKKSIMMNNDCREYYYITKFFWKKQEIKVFLPLDKVSKKAIHTYFNDFLMFDCVIGWHHRIMMHASIVNYKGEALLFTGPSGIGKSTQSNLWQEYFGADIINGDRAIIDADDGVIKAYGSPYAGSSEIYRNEGYPIKAIVFLSQKPQNFIYKLSIMESYKVLFPRFSMMRWDKNTTDIFMEIIMKIIYHVPIYHLSCRPDREAAEITYREIFGQNYE